MATLTIRNVPEDVKQELRIAAAKRGVSMEQEARDRLVNKRGSITRKSSVTAEQLLEMAEQLRDCEPLDARYRTLTSKEISDLVSEGEL